MSLSTMFHWKFWYQYGGKGSLCSSMSILQPQCNHTLICGMLKKCGLFICAQRRLAVPQGGNDNNGKMVVHRQLRTNSSINFDRYPLRRFHWIKSVYRATINTTVSIQTVYKLHYANIVIRVVWLETISTQAW